MTITRTLFTTLLILALPLFMLGCDGGGSAMEEPQQMEELKLSIYHPVDSGAQTNATIDRSASKLQSDDLLNVFVNGSSSSGNDVSKDAIGVTYPTEGNTAEVVFTVPAGNYDVDLLGFRDLDNPDRNSAVTFATTGDDESVNVTSGNVTEVRFDRQGDVLTEFDLSFNATLEFDANDNGNGNKPRQLDVTFQNDSEDPQTSLANRIFPDGSPFGGIGIDPNSGTIQGDRSNARDNEDFTSRNGATLTTDKFNLPPGQYDDGTASVLLELRIDDKYLGSGQDPVYLYNNVDGSAKDGLNIGGDGGIIVII